MRKIIMIVFVKKVHFLALLLLTVSDILAADLYHNCYATLEEQQADVAEMKANCLAYGG